MTRQREPRLETLHPSTYRRRLATREGAEKEGTRGGWLGVVVRDRCALLPASLPSSLFTSPRRPRLLPLAASSPPPPPPPPSLLPPWRCCTSLPYHSLPSENAIPVALDSVGAFRPSVRPDAERARYAILSFLCMWKCHLVSGLQEKEFF